jgi:hypothetical protein
MEIFETNESFDFEKLVLTKPTSISGGNYFIRFLMDGQPLYIQPPKCKTKQGIVKVDKRLYSDLMFTNENEAFIQWMENLENYSQQYIYKNREKWFEGDMELHDIENYFTSPLKLFKSGKYYISRTNVTSVLGKPTLKIYDENEKEVDYESISEDTNVMTILEVQGIKCSAKSFKIELELKQMMVLRPTNIFEKCIITPSRSENVEKPHLPTTKMAIEEVTLTVENSSPIVSETALPSNDVPEKPSSTDSPVDDVPETNSSENLTNEIIPSQQEQPLDGIEKPELKESIVDVDGFPILEEVEFHLEELDDGEPVVIKKRDNVYYEMYKEAKKKAKIARDLALSAYLEAKRIKNTYMLDELEDDSDDEDSEEDSDEDEEEDSDEEADEDEKVNNTL